MTSLAGRATAAACVLLLTCVSLADEAPKRASLVLADTVRDKIFYLFRILESSPAREVLRGQPVLSRLADNYRSRLDAALATCELNSRCYIDAVSLTESDISSAGDALQSLSSHEPMLREAVSRLRDSGIMVAHGSLEDSELLRETWIESAAGINQIFNTFGKGMPPPYPEIDSASVRPNSADLGQLLRMALRVVLAGKVSDPLFYSDSLKLAMLVLAINGRDEAGRGEPLDQRENRAALREIHRTDWTRYPHSVILVPGDGPESPNVKLSPLGRLRLEMAAERYWEHVAPFIILSGGYVHPSQTAVAEALEMKHVLVEVFRVPDSAILVDPQARHTTTNVRNAARIVYRYGIPLAMTALVVTDEYQADYVMSDAFDVRNRREIGVLPYASKARTSPTEIELTLSVQALQVNVADPLDP